MGTAEFDHSPSAGEGCGDVGGGVPTSHWSASLAKSERPFQNLMYRVIRKTLTMDLSALKGMRTNTHAPHPSYHLSMCVLVYVE